MRAHVSAFSTQKKGNERAEYEDSFEVGDRVGGDGSVDDLDRFRLAVADGASESFLAGRWARDLTSRFTTAPSKTGLPSVVRQAVAGWPALLQSYLHEREARGKPVQWFEERGLERGAYATLLGVELSTERTSPDRVGAIAWALGDTCAFCVRDDSLRESFPMSCAGEFGSNPELVQSRPVDVELTVARMHRRRFTWRSGDSIYLMTDALAQWFLASAEDGGEPWGPLRDLDTNDTMGSFEEMVARLRGDGSLHNDDTTLIRVDIY